MTLTGSDLNVGAVPEFLGVRVSIATQAYAHVDPVCRAGGTLAVPRRRVELVVSRVPARVSRVCTPSSRPEKANTCRGARGEGEVWRHSGFVDDKGLWGINVLRETNTLLI